MNPDSVRICARNNALWYAAVCGAHGDAGEFTDSMYANWRETPPFYGNGVTLTPDMQDQQLAIIDRLVASSTLDGDIGIKDSFHVLDLSSRGFEVLFEAEWIFCAPGTSVPEQTDPDLRCVRVDGPDALANWESAWRRDPANALPESQPAIFRPELLASGNIVFLTVEKRGEILGGAIANDHGGPIGLSNLFGTGENSQDWLAAIVAEACVLNDSPVVRPLVGYESREDLQGWVALGFEPIGPLRVWLKRA